MISKLVISVLTVLSGIIPKKKNLWLFGCWDGHLYGDNSKYMFEYINKNYPEIKAVWISKEKIIVANLRKNGYRAEYAKSLNGIFALCRAELLFETSGHNDLSFFVVKGVKEIQLWHGMGFKNVGKYDTQSQDKEKFPHFMDGRRINTYDLASWCVASNEALEKYSSSFDVPKENFHITGQPKDDLFINNEDSDLYNSILDGKSYKKVIFYLPTHRNFGRIDDKSMLEESMLEYVNSKLAEMDALMLYKPHYNDRKHFEDFKTELSNIKFLLDFEKYGDIYQILPFCDAMISDYSGIVFGFLNANKPIILFPYDIDNYITNDMGFCYDYKEVAAGPICKTWDEVVFEIGNIVNGKDLFKDKRKELIKRFCPLNDGKSKERVYQVAREISLQYERDKNDTKKR